MRVSTAQFYFQNSQQLSNKQSEVNDQVKYLSSGKRVLTAKDDALAYGTLAGYKEGLSAIEKYQRNLTQAENRNSLQEVSFSSAEDDMQQLKKLFIQANNGSLSDIDLDALADLVSNNQAQLLDIANSKDETGGYIFSGYKIDIQPFSSLPDNSVVYQGDSGVRELQIANNVFVDLNLSGGEAFEQVQNAIGDFSPTYIANTSGIAMNRAVIVNRGVYDPIASPPDYKFNFTSPTDLTVTDGGGAIVFTTAAYVSGQTVAFNGIEVQMNGNPLPGDSINLSPEDNISIFDTVKSAIDWLKTGSTAPNSVQRKVDYAEILSQIDMSLNHIISKRSDAGVRLQLIETQKNSHLDAQLYMSSGKSSIEDLDFAKAVSTYEQSKVALQAAQQTFVQIKDLSLFNYL